MNKHASPADWLSGVAGLVDPALAFGKWVGHAADPWQEELLHALIYERVPLLTAYTSRQCGKSSGLAAGGYLRAELSKEEFVVIAAPAQRQAGEVFLKLKSFRNSLGASHEADKDTEAELRLRNGSRILVIPCTEKTTRGLSQITCLILDEAARLADEDIEALIPAMADDATLCLASTPYGRRGFLHETIKAERGRIIKARSVDLPRKAKAVARDRAIMSARQFAQEHLLIPTGDASSFFDMDRVQEAIVPGEALIL